MKSIWLGIVIIILCSCYGSRRATQTYYYIEPFKEQEIKLYLNSDSTFNFEDLTGCNQFEFVGHYKQMKDSLVDYFVLDSIKLQNVLSNFNSDLIFPIKNGDTAWIINSERIFIHSLPFIATSNRNLNLEKLRYKKLEEYYVNLLGRKGFIKVFGNGKGRKEAKKRLLDCKLPDIQMK
jgi:hypothetical protein